MTPRPEINQDALLAQVSPQDGATASIKNGRVLVEIPAESNTELRLQMSTHLLETMSDAAA